MVGQLLSFLFIIALDHTFLLATDLLLGHLKERVVENHGFFSITLRLLKGHCHLSYAFRLFLRIQNNPYKFFPKFANIFASWHNVAKRKMFKQEDFCLLLGTRLHFKVDFCRMFKFRFRKVKIVCHCWRSMLLTSARYTVVSAFVVGSWWCAFRVANIFANLRS